MISKNLLDKLSPLFQRYVQGMELGRTDLDAFCRPPEQLVPHTQLRLALQLDPAMDALLTTSVRSIALGDESCAPFRLTSNRLILLSPVLLADSSALAAACRWGMEAAQWMQRGGLTEQAVRAILEHGVGLLSALAPASRQLLDATLHPSIAAGLAQAGDAKVMEPQIMSWLCSQLGETPPTPGTCQDPAPNELHLPLELLLTAGGDTRLALDPVTKLNRYGVCPRPRPEAVHFSSSTASAISEHGFLLCEVLRQLLLTSGLGQSNRQSLVDATISGIEQLLSLNPDETDVAIAPSGTDAELITVLLALAADPDIPLTNILISPEESGKGVTLAGAGKYFDSKAATGAPIQKQSDAFPGRVIEVKEVGIRDDDCLARPLQEVEAEIQIAVQSALDRGHRVLLHVLLGSKTGLSAPGFDAVDRLVRLAPDRIDVAVDACQMRSSWSELGDLARRGWLVQISGSKFLTGPPFSGAIILPVALRSRIGLAKDLLQSAPGVSHAEDWSPWWASRLPASHLSLSFGSLFRWLPAIFEGYLYASLPAAAKTHAFDRFRSAVVMRFQDSPYLMSLDDSVGGDSWSDMMRLSITAFQVRGADPQGNLRPLEEKECVWLFENLNRDLRSIAPELSPHDAATAALPCHIGQPVILHGKNQNLAFLRLVLGARFFNISAQANPDAAEAALESQIADAKRVLTKIEWIAAQWWKFQATMQS